LVRSARIALAAAAITLASGPDASAQGDACAAARAPLAPGAPAEVARVMPALEAYRAAWRRACGPGPDPADVAGLAADAEAIVTDVKLGPALARLAGALPAGAAWPIPGVRPGPDGLEVDWGAIAALAPRATVEDARSIRGLGRAMASDGEPVWLEPPRAGTPGCVRLVETSWSEVAHGLEEMEAANAEVFARRAALLRERLEETFRDLARGNPVCGCARGDPLPALDALAGGKGKVGTPARRELEAAASSAAQAIRSGKARLSFLRDAPGAPVTGCDRAP
jgi:hypothetical protein